MEPNKKTPVPEPLKQTLAQKAEHLIRDKFKPGLGLQAGAAREHGFNYVVDVYKTWWGRYFYFCAKYRNPRATAAEFFEVRTTRMEFVGSRRFDLAYMRHTGKWCEVYQALPLEECLETIESEELFWPVH